MVTITGYKVSENKEGEEFVRLEVQGGVMPVRSKRTNKLYLTSKKAYIASTYDEQTAEALIGVSIPGRVEKVLCEPFEYTIRETGESITMTHRYEYVEEEETIKQDESTQAVVSAEELSYLEEQERAGEIIL